MTKTVVLGSRVTLEYVGKLKNGMVFTKSSEDGPLNFEVGTYDVLKGLNQAILGMKLNEVKEVVLSPAEGFGDHDDKLIMTSHKDELPFEVKKGMQLKGNDKNQNEIIYSVTEVNEDGSVILDGNHLLAGYSLFFKVKVVEIQDERLIQ